MDASRAAPVGSLGTLLDRYPGKMVSRLADRLVRDYTQAEDSVLDPFCGSGAILVSAMRAGLPVTGMDLNPISELFCHVKLNGFDAVKALELGREWVSEAERVEEPLPVAWSGKSYWFTRGTLLKFERLRAAKSVFRDAGTAEVFAVLMSFTLAVRPCSRADQRSPKPFISRQARETRGGRHFDPNQTFLWLLERLARLYGSPRGQESKWQFVRWDVRRTGESLGAIKRHSHAITSPPYINAQDYFRNFKLELYMLEGLLPFSVSKLRERFIGTERGDLLDEVPEESFERNYALVRGLRDLEGRAPRLGAVVHRYLWDMERAFGIIEEKLVDEGRLVLVCGDNLVGGLKVCTWGALQEILEAKGFRLRERFHDRIRSRMLAPRRLGHRGLIKEEVVSVYQLA